MFQYLKSIVAGIKAGSAQGQLIKGNYGKALCLVDKAIALDADGDTNPVYLSIKGKCHYHLNEREKAKEYLEQAESHLSQLLETDEDGYVVNEISKIKGYIEKCG